MSAVILTISLILLGLSLGLLTVALIDWWNGRDQ